VLVTSGRNENILKPGQQVQELPLTSFNIVNAETENVTAVEE